MQYFRVGSCGRKKQFTTSTTLEEPAALERVARTPTLLDFASCGNYPADIDVSIRIKKSDGGWTALHTASPYAYLRH
jgi:hypothetical protein